MEKGVIIQSSSHGCQAVSRSNSIECRVKRRRIFQRQGIVSNKQRTQDPWVKIMSLGEMGVPYATDARQRVVEADDSFKDTSLSSKNPDMNHSQLKNQMKPAFTENEGVEYR